MTNLQNALELLEREHRLLTSGDFDALEGLSAHKEHLVGRLVKDSRDDADALNELSAAMTRNAGLLDAARRGFRQARTRVREIRLGATQTTYGQDGVKRPMSKRPRSIEQKF